MASVPDTSATTLVKGERCVELGRRSSCRRPSLTTGTLPMAARLGAIVLLSMAAFAAQAAPRQVVLLTDTGAARWEAFVTSRIRETLQRDRDDVEIFEETVDVARFPAQQTAVAALLQDKYASRVIDTALVVGPLSLAFLAERRDTLFPDSPIVYGGVRAASVPADLRDATGVASSVDLARTVELALALQPSARRLVAITGAGALDEQWHSRARAELEPYGDRLDVTYLAGLSKADLLDELRRLPRDTIVVLIALREDGAGQFFDGPAPAREITEAAAAPVYGVSEIYLGEGIVGGYVEPLATIGDSMVALTSRLLNGERVADLPAVEAASAYAVDWRALRRWNLDEGRLPPGTSVLFREPSFWTRYREPVLGFASLLALAALSTVALLLFARKRRAERALRQTEDRYLHVVEAQIDLICRYAPDTTLTFVNEAYCRYFGRRRDELIGRRFIDLIPEAERQRVLERVRSLVSEIRTVSYVHQARMPGGSVRWQQWLDHPIVDAEGRVVEVQGVGRDVTELKAAEAEAQQRREQVTHLTRVAILGELSGALAHELNQPMTAILSNAQTAERLLLQESPDLAELREIVRDIVADDVRAGEVIRRLRSMLKPGGTAFQALDVTALLAEVLALVRGQLLDQHVAVIERFSGPLPLVHGDCVQLQQVLLNLLMNACEAMRGNEPSDRTLVARASYDNGFVSVSISDTGAGFPLHVRERLFEPFFTTKAEGLGLGLSICRSIVNLHSGWISAHNNADRGATVEFVLPVAAAEAEDGDRHLPQPQNGFAGNLHAAAGR